MWDDECWILSTIIKLSHFILVLLFLIMCNLLYNDGKKHHLYTSNPVDYMSFIIQMTVDTDVMLIKIHMHMSPTMIPCTLWAQLGPAAQLNAILVS